MEICRLKFRIQSTGTALGTIIRFDGQEIFNNQVGLETVEIQHDFDDEIQGAHQLEIELHGKLPQHTVLDADGNIVQDSLLNVSALKMDGIKLKHLFYTRCVYNHDSNGTSQMDQHEFWGDMGCNGIVKFRFSSPVYLWLLENT